MLVVAAIALTVTPIFVVNAFRLLATDTFVRHEIDRGGFPPDRYGLTTTERRHLALTGLHSILPGGDGIALLERATLPDGSTAFDSRELRHMRDVRSRLGAAYTAQLVALIAILALAIALHRSRRWRSVVPWGLLLGSLLTLGIAALAVPGDPARLRRVLPALPRGLLQRRHLAFLGHRHAAAHLPGDVLAGHGEAGRGDRRRAGDRRRPRGRVVDPPDPPRPPRQPGTRQAHRDRPARPSRRRAAHRSSRRGDARSREHPPLVPGGGRGGRRPDRVRRSRPAAEGRSCSRTPTTSRR